MKTAFLGYLTVRDISVRGDGCRTASLDDVRELVQPNVIRHHIYMLFVVIFSKLFAILAEI